MSTSTLHFRDLLHAANLRHGTDGFTSLPKEGVLRIFSPLKIRRLRPGLNPRTWVPKASTLPLDHRSLYFVFFSSFLMWFFSCVMFLWIMLHLISQTYCILCWDSPSSPLWVWFTASWWELEVSLAINYILLYQFINPLACWFVAETCYCFPCVTLLNRGMSQHTHTRHTHMCGHLFLV